MLLLLVSFPVANVCDSDTVEPVPCPYHDFEGLIAILFLGLSYKYHWTLWSYLYKIE